MGQQRPPEPFYNSEEIDFRNLLKTMGKWKKTILSVTIIVMLISGIYSYYFVTPIFEAKAVVAPVTSNEIGLPGNMTYVVNNQNGNDFTDRQKLLDNMDNLVRLNQIDYTLYKEMITSDYVLKRTITSLNLKRLKPEKLRDKISAGLRKNGTVDTNIIEVSVRNSDPELAAKIANALVKEASTYIYEFNKNQMDKLDQALEAQLAEAQADMVKAKADLEEYQGGAARTDQPASIEVRKLEDKIQRYQDILDSYNSKIMELKVRQALCKSGDHMVVLSAATVPETPAKPNKILNLAIACVLGLFVSISGVLLVEYIRNTDEDESGVSA
ncbi:MAG: hypothetical protein GXY34_06055 [Syntrophomonadaceae bacterium]|nr:hypothetical protein [Syntrophomonadaceae bacterium]